MARATRRLILSASFLVMLLPPCWCGFVSVPTFRTTKETSKKPHSGCCDNCCCKGRKKPPPEPEQPVPPCRCCGYGCEVDWLKPNPPENPVVDSALFMFFVPQDLGSTCAVVHDADLSIPGPSPPLHVLKCVWLC